MSSDHGHYHLTGAHASMLETAEGELHVGTPAADRHHLVARRARGRWPARRQRRDREPRRARAARRARCTGAPRMPGRCRVASRISTSRACDRVSRDDIGFPPQRRGERLDPQSDLEAHFRELTGSVRGAARRGSWRSDASAPANGCSTTCSCSSAPLISHSTAAPASAGNAMNLNFTVDADDLALLHPGAHGRLQAHGFAARRAARSDAARQREAQGSRLGGRAIWIHSTPRSPSTRTAPGRNDASIEVAGLTIAGRRLETLKLRTEGTTARSHRRARCARRGVRPDAARRGPLRGRPVVRADRTARRSATATNLHLRLEAPVALEVAFDRLHVESMCLHDDWRQALRQRLARGRAAHGLDSRLEHADAHADRRPDGRRPTMTAP